jgi:hypothetical protein
LENWKSHEKWVAKLALTVGEITSNISELSTSPSLVTLGLKWFRGIKECLNLQYIKNSHNTSQFAPISLITRVSKLGLREEAGDQLNM